MVHQGTDKQFWSSELPLLLRHPWVYSTVSPMWGSKGNGFDLLNPDPLSLGVKQNIGQWDRMFLDNFSCERRSSSSLSFSLSRSLSLCRSVWKMWEVCLTEPTAGLLKEWTEARKEANNIPLKCTDNWNPMGCSRSACCDGWVAGPSSPWQRDHKLKRQPCCSCGPLAVAFLYF